MKISVPIELELKLPYTDVVDDTTKFMDDSDNHAFGAGGYHTAIITDGGELGAMGDNTYGQLGTGNNTSYTTITPVGIPEVRSVTCGFETTFIVKEDGTLWATGNNTYGQLGIGSYEHSNVFVYTGLTNVRSVDTYSDHALALRADGTVWATGRNRFGALGLGDTEGRSKFTQVEGVVAAHIGSGGEFSAIIASDGSLWATGANDKGQFGNGTTTPSLSYVQIEVGSDRPIIGLATAFVNTSIILNDHTLWATGYNAQGQLGIGTTTDVLVFTDTGMADIVSVDRCGTYSYCGDNSGVAYSTGDNAQGQLGIGTTTDSNVYVPVSIISPYQNYFSCGSKHVVSNNAQTGDVYVCGSDLYGQLGINDGTFISDFIQLSGVSVIPIRHTSWITYVDGDSLQKGDSIYYITTIGGSPSALIDLTLIGANNTTSPFDGKSYTTASSTSTMFYRVYGVTPFDTLALGNMRADHMLVEFYEAGEYVTPIQVIDRDIDSSRDILGNLPDWSTTNITYSDVVLHPVGELLPYVEVTLTYIDSKTVELGTLLLGISADAGFTNLTLANQYKDYSNFETDPFGNIDYVERAKVSKYSGTVDIRITNYDMTDRLMTSLGANVVIMNGSNETSCNCDSLTVFAATQKIGRITNFNQKTVIADGDLDVMATYSFTLEEIV